MRTAVAVPTLLVATVAGPYVATNAPQWSREWTAGLQNGQAQSQPLYPGSQASSAAKGLPSLPNAQVGNSQSPLSQKPQQRTAMPLEGALPTPLAEVLRFDVTKEWVYQRWPRKSTALSELDLYGVRVPLVTGTQLPDLAGSLTYFFDAGGRVQRISFHGRTADTTQIVNLVVQQFGLSPQPTPVVGEQLFRTMRGTDVLSELRTRPAPVLWSTSLHESFSVDLELQDPTTARPLPMQKLPEVKPEAAKAPATKNGEGGKAEEAKSEGWKNWFPRSRVSKSQLRQLDAVDLAE